MNCDDLLRALNEFVDGEVDPSICDTVRAHLADCNPCQIVVDNIRRTITLYKAGEPIPMPPELCRHLREVLKAKWSQHFSCSQG